MKCLLIRVSRVRTPDRALKIAVFADIVSRGDGGFFVPQMADLRGFHACDRKRTSQSKAKRKIGRETKMWREIRREFVASKINSPS